jgi:hypothetical protein
LLEEEERVMNPSRHRHLEPYSEAQWIGLRVDKSKWQPHDHHCKAQQKPFRNAGIRIALNEIDHGDTSLINWSRVLSIDVKAQLIKSYQHNSEPYRTKGLAVRDAQQDRDHGGRRHILDHPSRAAFAYEAPMASTGSASSSWQPSTRQRAPTTTRSWMPSPAAPARERTPVGRHATPPSRQGDFSPRAPAVLTPAVGRGSNEVEEPPWNANDDDHFMVGINEVRPTAEPAWQGDNNWRRSRPYDSWYEPRRDTRWSSNYQPLEWRNGAGETYNGGQKDAREMARLGWELVPPKGKGRGSSQWSSSNSWNRRKWRHEQKSVRSLLAMGVLAVAEAGQVSVTTLPPSFKETVFTVDHFSIFIALLVMLSFVAGYFCGTWSAGKKGLPKARARVTKQLFATTTPTFIDGEIALTANGLFESRVYHTHRCGPMGARSRNECLLLQKCLKCKKME